MNRTVATLLAALLTSGCYLMPIDPGTHGGYPQPAGPVCGDGYCDPGESCASCATDCGVCPAPATPSWDIDLGSGALTQSGTTRGRADESSVACGDGGQGADVSYRWVAPYAGTWIVSVDSSFRTLLDVRADSSTGPSLSCIDVASGYRSVAVSLGSRQAIVIIVDGARNESGSFHLTIEAAEFCGDGTCGAGETCGNCPGDCGACSTCGDGVCNSNETVGSCPSDCVVRAYCGDGYCDSNENSWNCAADCAPATYCGDGSCDPGEDSWNCAADCAPAPVCGDGYCDPGEDCNSCSWDCGTCGW